jgi:hypothetical protein
MDLLVRSSSSLEASWAGVKDASSAYWVPVSGKVKVMATIRIRIRRTIRIKPIRR